MNTSIKAKLLTGISIILLLLLSTVFFIFWQFSNFNERFSRVVDLTAERIFLSEEIMHGVMEVSLKEKNVILEYSLNPGEKEAELNVAIKKVEKNLLRLESQTPVEEKQLVADFKYAWAGYLQKVREVVVLSKQKKQEEATELSTGQVRQVRQQAVQLLNQLISQSKAKMEQEKNAGNENYKAVLKFTTGLILLTLIIAGLLSWRLIHTVSGRINTIAADAKKIASRELLDIQINDEVRDELHPVTESLNDILNSFREITYSAGEVANGDYSLRIIPRSENDHLGVSLQKMKESLAKTTSENKEQTWMISGLNFLNEKLSGEQSIPEITENAVGFLCGYIGANIGALYLLKDNNLLELTGKYAFTPQEKAKETYSFGEGLIGQAAVNKDLIHIRDYAREELKVSSVTINERPVEVLVAPFFFDEQLIGVVEVGKLRSFTSAEVNFFRSTLNTLAINIKSAINREKINNLLEETQAQGEELQVQQEELRHANQELEEQTHNLRHQQEELQVANEELEEQANQLDAKNKQLEKARSEVEKKSLQIEESSRYKSQFLANMSHELRTPLNSLLILAKDLADNKKKNLDEEQVESAGIVYKSGKDLLQLINEVLDLSKIEAGKMELHIEEFALTELLQNIKRTFGPAAREKGLALSVHIGPEVPEFITTDIQRLEQIVKNLVSNSLKFTEKGTITVEIKGRPGNTIAIEVKDSGIGIPEEKHAMIFEAFQQADGGTSRKYGGTGLGLSISRQLARLMGGTIMLESKEMEGTCFSLIIPVNVKKTETDPAAQNSLWQLTQEERITSRRPAPVIAGNKAFENFPGIPDDRNILSGEDKTLLIIEDDLHFAEILKKQAYEKGFKVLAATTGEDGLMLAEKYKPKAIILDLVLPGMQGRMVLRELKENTALRHIPVHIISSHERTLDVIRDGAMEFLTKPVDKEQLEQAFRRIENFIDKKMKSLLVVEDNENLRKAIKKLIGSSDVEYFESETGKKALKILKEESIDCVVLDLGLPDISGFELIKKLQKIKGEKIPPIIIYTGKELSKEENDELHNFAESIIIKGVKSEERLLDETALFLHRTVSELPEAKKDILAGLYDKEAIFNNKKILVADDDMRNVFALSKVLREYGMEIIKAENGLKAVEALKAHEDIALVLMDIMMPVMDGLEAMKAIRATEKYKDIPIIAITAKAMKEDRIKCIKAGANDYISKPVETEHLLSLMRVWIKR